MLRRGPGFSCPGLSGPEAPRGQSRALTARFVATLAIHVVCAIFNWRAPFMPGREFRQAQTAIISHYIDRQDNFSLLYETPIVGKPWVGLRMELPVYEWAVALPARAPRPGEVLRFMTRPNGSHAYDWACWSGIAAR